MDFQVLLGLLYLSSELVYHGVHLLRGRNYRLPFFGRAEEFLLRLTTCFAG